MTISTSATGELRLAPDEIRLRENVRELDDAQVETLAQSIALRGLLVGPVKGGVRVSPAHDTALSRTASALRSARVGAGS